MRLTRASPVGVMTDGKAASGRWPPDVIECSPICQVNLSPQLLPFALIRTVKLPFEFPESLYGFGTAVVLVDADEDVLGPKVVDELEDRIAPMAVDELWFDDIRCNEYLV